MFALESVHAEVISQEGFLASEMVITTAVLEAVFGYLIQKTDALEFVKRTLGLEPEKAAFRKALSNSWRTFKDTHPEWSASFFDEAFMKGRAAPVLARCLARDGPPEPFELAAAWADQFPSARETRHEHIEEAQKPASDFLQTLTTELRGCPELHPYFDSQALERILGEQSRLGDVSDRKGSQVRDRIEEMTERVGDAISLAMSSTVLQGNISYPLTLMGLPQVDSMPVPVEIRVPRTELVLKLNKSLSNAAWLALVAGSGMGKTQLARALVENRRTGTTRWISASSQENPARHVETQLIRWLVDVRHNEGIWQEYLMGVIDQTQLVKLLCESVGGEALLIIDDIPDFLQDERLMEVLIYTASIFEKYGIGLVTTSQREFPPQVQSHLGDSLVAYKAPPFSEGEVLELLIIAGCPCGTRNDDLVSLVLAVTKGMPSLVSAAVHWLKKRRWKLGEGGFEELLRGEPLRDLRSYEMRRASVLLEPHPRDLLYRLSLLWEDFDTNLALRIASSPPRITYPGECLNELAGPWITSLERGHYQVSPVFVGAGRLNLSEETQRLVHRTAADYYLEEGRIDASRAHLVATHLWGAGDYTEFARLLTQLLLNVKTSTQAKYVDWAITVVSPDMEWPRQIELGLRIMLRAAQVRARIVAGGDAQKLEEDLENLLDRAGPDEHRAVIVACLFTGPLIQDKERTGRDMLKAIRAVRLIRETQVLSPVDFPQKFEDIIWIQAAYLSELDDVRQFLLEIKRMSDQERSRLFDADLAAETTVYLSDRVWMNEAEKPVEEQDWHGVLAILDELRDVGRLPGALPLRFAEARARSVVLADYLRQPEAALDLLNSVPKLQHPELEFLRHYAVGCTLFDIKNFESALRALTLASTTEGDGFWYYRLDTRRRLCIAESRLGRWDAAQESCIQSLHFIENTADVPDLWVYDRLELMGELAWICWMTGHRMKACGAMYGAVSEMNTRGDIEEPRCREAFNKIGHALGWFALTASEGQPPHATSSGELYSPVEGGLFGIRRPSLGELKPAAGFSNVLLLMQLCHFAEAVGMGRTAFRVCRLAYSLGQTDGTTLMVGLAGAELAPLSGRFDAPREALQVGLDAVKFMFALQKLREATMPELHDSVDWKLAWASASREERQNAEHDLLKMTVGPAIAELIGGDFSEEAINERLRIWISVLTSHQVEFEDQEYWNLVSQIFEDMLSPTGKALLDQQKEIAEEDSFLRALLYLVCSRQRARKMHDKLQMHVYAVDFFVRFSPFGRDHILPGVGSFIHRFWLDIAKTRGFALRSPQLFRDELREISPLEGETTAVKVLMAASSAISVRLPRDILSRFSQGEQSATRL